MDCPDPELLQRLVDRAVVPTEQELLEEHLRGCPTCRERMERAAANARTGAQALKGDIDLDALLGSLRSPPNGSSPGGPLVETIANLQGKLSEAEEWPVIPGYEIQRFLGRGGMGRVYLARQERLNRLVAIKMIRSTGDENMEEWVRFRNEADALARLKHPNIVQIYEVGTSADQPYLILELVEGGSLGDVLDGTPWSPPVAAGLVEILARAVQHAHDHKIIHRDLKPSNVLVSVECRIPSAADQDDISLMTLYSALGTLRPKIADFGLAKFTDVQNDLTESGFVVGTPSYMAPEQARGSRTEIGPQTDVYALGAILYELLTGGPPFKGDTPNDTLWKVIYEDPRPPSHIQPKVPRDLETICLKCLEKVPERRYASADALAEDLGRIISGRAIKARRASLLKRVSKWTARHKVLAMLLAALVPAGIGAAIALAWQSHGSQPVEVPDDGGEQARRVTELESELEKVRWELYAANLARAQEEWQQGNDDEAHRRLERCPKEYRHWEYAFLKRLMTNQDPPQKVRVGPITLSVFDVPEAQTIPVIPGVPWYCCLNTDGSRALLSGGGSKALQWWDVPSGKLIWSRPAQGANSERIALTSDGKRFVVGAPEGLELRDTATGQLLQTFADDETPIIHLALSRDGQQMVTVSDTHIVKVREIASGKLLFRRDESDSKTKVACFNADRRQVLTGGRTGVHVLDAENGNTVRRLGEYKTFDVAASPDGRFLATGGPGLVEFTRKSEVPRGVTYLSRVWDAATGTERATLPGGNTSIVVYSPDNERIVGAIRAQVQVWHAQMGQPLLTLRGHTEDVTSIAFSADGRKLITGSTDGAVRIWDGRP